MPVKSKPGADIYEAMPEQLGWMAFHSAAKETNVWVRWIMESNVSAVALSPCRLVLFCPVQTSLQIVDPVLNPDWEGKASPQWLLWKLHFTEIFRKAMPKHTNTAEALTFPWSTGSTTNSVCLFRTRAGRMGLLQITGCIENPLGVKIRYKLVMGTKGTSDDALPSPEAGANSPQVR